MYTNIFTIIKEHNFKKIFIRRNTWSKKCYARIDAIITTSKQSEIAKVIGYANYGNNDYEYKLFDCANSEQWEFIGVLKENVLLIEDSFYYQKFKWKHVYSKKQYDIVLDKIRNKILL